MDREATTVYASVDAITLRGCVRLSVPANYRTRLRSCRLSRTAPHRVAESISCGDSAAAAAGSVQSSVRFRNAKVEQTRLIPV
jgi:hypothetical protein